MRFQQILIRFDWILLLTILTLMSVGLVVMYGIGISRPDGGMFMFQKQLTAVIIGFVVILVLGFLDYRQVRSLAIPAYAFGAALLIAVLFIGETVCGTRGWFTFGGLSFQPVEIAKLLLVIFLASYLARYTHRKLSWHVIAGSLLATLGYIGLVMLQPDLGSALVMLAIWGVFILAVGINWRAILAIFAVVLLTAGLAWSFVLKPYQQARLLAFVNPSVDERGAGYNVMQAQIAIGSGGLLGKGIGEGSQARLRFLPEAATDFTFAVVGEELGFVGLAFILGLFGLLFQRLYNVARDAEDDFSALLILGIGSILFIHLTVNAGMNLGVMPVTGIPFPFLSAASSFLLAICFALGLVESIAVRRRTYT
jgi:rod shape determining protein RodA